MSDHLRAACLVAFACSYGFAGGGYVTAARVALALTIALGLVARRFIDREDRERAARRALLSVLAARSS